MKSAALILLGLGLCLSNQVDATIASDEATRSLLWGEGLQALGQGEKAVGNLQAATGFWTQNPALFKAGVGNVYKGYGTEFAGDYVKAVTEGRRLLNAEESEAAPADDEATRSLLWGEGLQALGQGEKAVGNLQAATGFWTQNPALFKAGVGNVYRGFGTGFVGDAVKAVTEGRRLLDAEEVDDWHGNRKLLGGQFIHSGGHPRIHRAAEFARKVGRAEALAGAYENAVGRATNNPQLAQRGAAVAARGVQTAAAANGVARATRCRGCYDPELARGK